MLYFSSVQFQLGFSGALVAHAAAGSTLSAQIFSHTHKSWQHILQSCSFHLQLCLLRFCPDGKNIQNQICSVQNRQIQLLYQISYLGRRKCIVKNHFLCLTLSGILLYFSYLAASDIKCFIYRKHPLDNHAHRLF